MVKQNCVIAIGPTLPHNGMMRTTVNLVSSRAQEIDFVLLDAWDRRRLQYVGLLDVGNVQLAFVHAVGFSLTGTRSFF